MNAERQIPYYAPDGTSLGLRTPEAARRLIAGGCVKAAYGRKGHLRAIWLLRADGSNPILSQAKPGTKYSYKRQLEHGRCWQHKGLARKDEDGVAFNGRNVFLQVVNECLAG